MDTFFIFCAQYLFIAVFLIAAFCFFKLQRPLQIEIVVLGISAAILSYLIALIGGQLYTDPRPFVLEHFKPLIAHDTENGFPSDHVLMLSLVASVFTFYQKKVAVVLWIITLTVAYARIYVGVHHFIDVFASALITITVTYILRSIFKRSFFAKAAVPINKILNKIGLEG